MTQDGPSLNQLEIMEGIVNGYIALHRWTSLAVREVKSETNLPPSALGKSTATAGILSVLIINIREALRFMEALSGDPMAQSILAIIKDVDLGEVGRPVTIYSFQVKDDGEGQ